MRNFYREFTKDLERRLASRAYDIRPQTVLNNEVQMVVDLERPFYKDITWQWRQANILHSAVAAPTAQGFIYGQTPVVLSGSTVTPLTGGLPASSATQNRPTYIAVADDVVRVELLDVKYFFQVRNTSGSPTTTSQRLSFFIQKHGTSFDPITPGFDADYYNQSTAGIIPAGGQQLIQNSQRPNDDLVRRPIIWNLERVNATAAPGTSFGANAENQLTWGIFHSFDATLESITTTFTMYVAIKCRVYFETPYSQVYQGNVGTPV